MSIINPSSVIKRNDQSTFAPENNNNIIEPQAIDAQNSNENAQP